MIIDLILDRYEQDIKYNSGAKRIGPYDPGDFYRECMCYGSIGHDITRALDSGTENDVKTALCEYVVNNDYNPAICGYIHSVNWLSNTMAANRIAPIL